MNQQFSIMLNMNQQSLVMFNIIKQDGVANATKKMAFANYLYVLKQYDQVITLILDIIQNENINDIMGANINKLYIYLTRNYINNKNYIEAKKSCDKIENIETYREDKLCLYIEIYYYLSMENECKKCIKDLLSNPKSDISNQISNWIDIVGKDSNILECIYGAYIGNIDNTISIIKTYEEIKNYTESNTLFKKILYEYIILLWEKKETNIISKLLEICYIINYRVDWARHIEVMCLIYEAQKTSITDDTKQKIEELLNTLSNSNDDNIKKCINCLYGDYYMVCNRYLDAYNKYNTYEIKNREICIKIREALKRFLKCDGLKQEYVKSYRENIKIFREYYNISLKIIFVERDVSILKEITQYLLSCGEINHAHTLIMIGLNGTTDPYYKYIYAKYIGNPELREVIYMELLESNYNNIDLYIDLSRLYMEKKNTDAAYNIIKNNYNKNKHIAFIVECANQLYKINKYLYLKTIYRCYNKFLNSLISKDYDMENLNIIFDDIAITTFFVVDIFKIYNNYNGIAKYYNECFALTKDYKYLYLTAKLYYNLGKRAEVFKLAETHNLMENYPRISIIYVKIYADILYESNTPENNNTLKIYKNIALEKCPNEKAKIIYSLNCYKDMIISLNKNMKLIKSKNLNIMIEVAEMYFEEGNMHYLNLEVRNILNYSKDFEYPYIIKKIKCFTYLLDAEIKMEQSIEMEKYIKNYIVFYPNPEIIARLYFKTDKAQNNYVRSYFYYYICVSNIINDINKDDTNNILTCCIYKNDMTLYKKLIYSKLANFVIASKRKYKRTYLTTELTQFLLDYM